MLLIFAKTAEMAKSLLETKSIRETISVGKKTDVALLGIGTTSPDYSSFYLAGYITRRELDDLRKAGAIGDVCGLHFDVNGQPACDDFCERLVSIRRQDLLSIPVRLGSGRWGRKSGCHSRRSAKQVCERVGDRQYDCQKSA